ncbi:MAG: hypothetical protein Q9219_001065 [cf. Caloplaca sp. 3 TL-2023]
MHLILDWDGTLTTASTLSLIAQIGYDANASSTYPRNLPPWESFTEAYLADYRAHASAYTLSSSCRVTIEQELAWLESLRDVERKSTERIEDADIFQGVKRDHVRAAAREAIKEHKVVLREGWADLMETISQKGGKIGVVSVGWSAEFIRECLESAAGQSSMEAGGVGKKVDIERVDIRANNISAGGTGRMSRYFEEGGRKGRGGVWTAGDKRKIMEDMFGEEPRNLENMLVYVGDSVTDLHCLLSADIGICMRDQGEMSTEQQELEHTLTRLEIACRWIGHLGPNDLENLRAGSTNIRNSLWWGRNFRDIYRSLQSSSCKSQHQEQSYLHFLIASQ